MGRHTASAAEMIVIFARENNLARIVGEKTAGRLLSGTSVRSLGTPTGVANRAVLHMARHGS